MAKTIVSSTGLTTAKAHLVVTHASEKAMVGNSTIHTFGVLLARKPPTNGSLGGKKVLSAFPISLECSLLAEQLAKSNGGGVFLAQRCYSVDNGAAVLFSTSSFNKIDDYLFKPFPHLFPDQVSSAHLLVNGVLSIRYDYPIDFKNRLEHRAGLVQKASIPIKQWVEQTTKAVEGWMMKNVPGFAADQLRGQADIIY